MSNQKKQSFLGGAAILAAAVVVVKFIGFFYKVPLNNILGGPGKTYFDTAYKIYNFLLTFSTAGLPLAISRMTSQAHARGLENEKRRIFSTAIWLFFGLGLVCSVLMFFRADALARLAPCLCSSRQRAWQGFWRTAWRPSPSGRWLRRCSACACWPVCGATRRVRAT